MRTHGTLIKWNDERGFGFIQSSTGAEEVFVHISAFPRDGARPVIGELISFELKVDPTGKRRAVRVMRAGTRVKRSHSSYRRRVRSSAAWPSAVLKTGMVLLLLIVIGYSGYAMVTMHQAALDAPAKAEAPAEPTRHVRVATPTPTPMQTAICDGRTRCSQMTSCAEATQFLKQCPGTVMDGDRDGIPCEDQWCRAAY